MVDVGCWMLDGGWRIEDKGKGFGEENTLNYKL
jgi:hypothetical protein